MSEPGTRSSLGSLQFVYVILFLVVGTQGRAVNPDRRISQYGHTAWRTQDDFFGGPAHAITQTKDGYLWIGTESGLVRFDGVRFVSGIVRRGKSVPSSIESLLGASDGSLWIGTARGLIQWRNGAPVEYSQVRGRFNSILEDPQGNIWTARSRPEDKPGALCKIADKDIRCYSPADGLNCATGNTLALDPQGTFWVGGASGLCSWEAGRSNRYLQQELKETESLVGVTTVAAEKDGSLVLGTNRTGRSFGLRRFFKGHSSSYVVPGLDGSNVMVNTLFLDRNDALWVGTASQGIYRIYDGKADHFSASDGLSGDSVVDFYQDRENNLWVATSKGIDRFRDLSVASFSVREGLTADSVASVVTGRDGTVWIGNQGALDALQNGTISKITSREGLPGKDVTSMFEDHAGRLWVGTDQNLTVRDHGGFRLIKRGDGSEVGAVFAIAEDRDHNIWVEVFVEKSTRLIRIQDEKVREELPASKIPRASALAGDPDGGIVLGMMNGALARYRNEQLELLANPSTERFHVFDVLADSDGSAWAATPGGLVRWRDGKVKVLTSRNGLPCDQILALLRDNLHSLWLSTKCGYVRIDDSELEKWWNEADISIKVSTLDAFEGAQPALSSFRPEASRSPDGRLWFANDTVLQMIDPKHLDPNGIPPPVYIEQIIADKKAFSPKDGVRLPALTHDLEIDYTALSFVNPAKVRFRYELEGRETTWQEPGTRRQAFYNDLRPGQYRFHVIACNNDGVWNEQGAALTFDVSPAWYQRVGFRIFLTAVGLLAVWGVYQIRMREAAKAMNVRFEERLAERTRLARELHDTLLQSFQALTLRFQAVSNLLPARPLEARERLDGAIDQAAQAITEGRRAVQGLRSSGTLNNDLSIAISTLGEELAAGELKEAPPVFHVELEGTPRDLRSILRDDVYRIVGEALRNAFRHGEAQKIEVEIRYDETQLRVRIRDDGKGIDPQVLNGAGRAGHWGLAGMRERTKLIGGKLEVWSSLRSGTEIELSIPASIAYVGSTTGLRSWFYPRGA